MENDQKEKGRLEEGYEPLQKGFTPAEKKGYSPLGQGQPTSKPPQGGSGGMPKPPVADKK